MPQYSMTETLFGGLLLTIALFFIAKKSGLSNFWSSLLAGAVPFIAYVVYAQQHWAGGDVLAIHFAVFLATAGVLFVFAQTHQKKQKMHWGPKVLIAFFVGLILLNAFFLSVSMHGVPDAVASVFLPKKSQTSVHTVFPGIIPHDANKSYQPHLQRLENQRALDWQVTLDGINGMATERNPAVKITVLDKNRQPIKDAKIKLDFWRMANSQNDMHVMVPQTEVGGVYAQTLHFPYEGRWMMRLEITSQEGVVYFDEQNLYIK